MLFLSSQVAQEDAMKATLMERMKKLNAKRVIALAIAPGAMGLGLDAAISHFAGRDMANPAQLIPVTFAPLAAMALMFLAAPHRTARVFRLGVRWVGAVGIAVGLVGTGFHVRALLRLLAGTPLTFANVGAALAVAPPLFAPGAFAAIGVLVWLLGSPRVAIELKFGTARPAGFAELAPRAA
jgi:hypothetical protein